MAHTVIGFYDNMDTAQQVVRELQKMGISRDQISLVANDVSGEYGRFVKEDTSEGAATGAGVGAAVGGIGGLLVGLGALTIPGIGPVIAAGPLATALSALLGAGAGALAGGVAGGLIGALVDAGVPEEEASYYAEGVRRGGVLVTVDAEESLAMRARDLMNRFGAVDIAQRATMWRESGWKGYDVKAKPYTTKQVAKEREQYFKTSGLSDAQRKLDKGGDVRLPVVEEEVAIGKREVETGGVRIHQRVTERPVQEDVTLRREHVKVERHPVDKPADPSMIDTMREGSLELHERSEEAVIDKRARVVEEVVVNKDVEQHTERIQDTVRRSDVEVEKTGGKMTDMDRFRTGWRGHYQSHLANRGYQYEHYEPAYQFGYELRNDQRYRDYNDWSRLEPDARRDWERRSPGTWEEFKDSIRFAWENFKAKVRD